jgi:hypothetical protein
LGFGAALGFSGGNSETALGGVAGVSAPTSDDSGAPPVGTAGCSGWGTPSVSNSEFQRSDFPGSDMTTLYYE